MAILASVQCVFFQQCIVCAQSGREMFANDNSVSTFIRSVMSALRRFSSCCIWLLHWQCRHVPYVSTCQTLATCLCERLQAELWLWTWGLHSRMVRVSQSRICLDRIVLGSYCTQKMGHNVPPKHVYVFTETWRHILGDSCSVRILPSVTTCLLQRVGRQAVSWLRRVDVDYKRRRPGFERRTVNVGFVVDKVGLGRVFVTVIRDFPVTMISPVLLIN
jgi:hypothetical protein